MFTFNFTFNGELFYPNFLLPTWLISVGLQNAGGILHRLVSKVLTALVCLFTVRLRPMFCRRSLMPVKLRYLVWECMLTEFLPVYQCPSKLTHEKQDRATSTSPLRYRHTPTTATSRLVERSTSVGLMFKNLISQTPTEIRENVVDYVT